MVAYRGNRMSYYTDGNGNRIEDELTKRTSPLANGEGGAVEKDDDPKPRVATALNLLAGIVLFAGITCGFILAVNGSHGYGIISAIGVWIGSAVTACFVLGFAKIIELLDKIAKK